MSLIVYQLYITARKPFHKTFNYAYLIGENFCRLKVKKYLQVTKIITDEKQEPRKLRARNIKTDK